MVSIGLGTMIGGGIFTTIGPGVNGGARDSDRISACRAASFFAALAYAELGSMVPIAGSAYTYSYATLGKLVAWIIGFALLFEYGISAAPVAQQFSGAIQDVLKEFGFAAPWAQRSHLIINGPWWIPGSWDFAHSHCDLIGAAFVLLLAALLSLGIRESATRTIFSSCSKSVRSPCFDRGHRAVSRALVTPFAPYGWGSLRPFSGGGGFGVIPAAALVFFNYIGFDSTTTAEECKDPQRDVPLGVMGALRSER